MKKLMMLLLFAGLPASAQQAGNTLGYAEFNERLDRMCRQEYVTLEYGRACRTGGLLVFGAPPARDLADYLALVDQCLATYQDADADFGVSISSAELRAACQTGLAWARTVIYQPDRK